jgi:arylsulfatase A-like enzyme
MPLRLAITFGLLAGLLEGTLAMVLQVSGLRAWGATAGVEIPWIAAMFDAAVFAVIAALLAVGPPRLVARAPVPLFTFLAVFPLLVLTGRVAYGAAALLALGVGAVAARLFDWERRSRLVSTAMVVLAVVTAAGWAGTVVVTRVLEGVATARLVAPPDDPRNVMVVVIDTLRADHLSAYGYHRPTSPTLDRLAREGVAFDNALSASSWTLPAHASLLTGRFPNEHRIESTHALNAAHRTVAEVFAGSGYRTGAFSANLSWFNRTFGFGRGFLHFEDLYQNVGDMAWRTTYGQLADKAFTRLPVAGDFPGRRRAADMNRSILRWIDRDRQRPFFVFVNYFDTHDPYLPPRPYRTGFAGEGPEPGGVINSRLRNPDDQSGLETHVASEIAAYDGAIAYVDAQIAELVSALEARHLLDNTIVVFTSDHGEAFGEHGLWVHRNSLYPEETRVPLIIWGKTDAPAGLRVSRPVSTVSIPATVLDLAALDASAIPGGSLTVHWRDPEKARGLPDVVAEIDRQPYAPMRKRPVFSGALRALVGPRWYVIEHQVDGVQLYDWTIDPGARNDLAATSEGQQVIKELTPALAWHAVRASTPAAPQ